MNRNKYNDIICNAVRDCTKEIKSLMEERGLRMVDFVEHEVDIPNTVFENGDTGEFTFEEVKSIHINDCNEIILTGNSGITGYLDGEYGDYFDVADTVGRIYAALYDVFEKIDSGKSHFTKEEYEEKYSHGVTKDMWATIIILLELQPSEVSAIKSMKIVESNENFDYIYIDVAEKSKFGANYCVIRDKKNGDIYMPTQANGAYPASIKDISMYTWVNQNNEKIMINSDNEMENYNAITKQRLEYLNKNFPDIFDGISFVWHKNHTMCVKSKTDERNGDTKTSYVAIYNHHDDIVPVKLSKMEKLDVDFPPLS